MSCQWSTREYFERCIVHAYNRKFSVKEIAEKPNVMIYVTEKNRLYTVYRTLKLLNQWNSMNFQKALTVRNDCVLTKTRL